MMSSDDFRAQYPEFAKTDPKIVQKALDWSALRTDSSIFKDKTDEAHALLACHILSVSPFGRAAALPNEKKTSPYGDMRDKLEKTYCAGYGVT